MKNFQFLVKKKCCQPVYINISKSIFEKCDYNKKYSYSFNVSRETYFLQTLLRLPNTKTLVLNNDLELLWE